MNDKKGLNWFFAFIAFSMGITLFKHIDFKNLTFKEGPLDILYLIVFIVSIYIIIRDLKKKQTNKNSH